MKELNPKDYSLSSRVKLLDTEAGEIAIVKRIKSRIIRKDAEKIIEMAQKITEVAPEKKIVLICNDNICSKSTDLLNDKGIKVLKS